MATHHEKLEMLPFRRDLPRVRRLYRTVSLVAGWCSWRCPLAALVLIVAAHTFPTPIWWRAICDILVAIAMLLIFCSFGFSAALLAVLVQRPDRWFEHVGRYLSILGGLAIAAVGFVGVWTFLISAFHLR
jgi:hypothetical protein